MVLGQKVGLRAILVWALFLEPSLAGESVSALSSVEEKHRRALSATLSLTGRESDEFWPLYEAYQKEMNAEFERVAEVAYRFLDHAHPVPDSISDDYLMAVLEGDSHEAAINRSYHPKIRRILDASQTVRFFQFERRFRNHLSMELENDMPPLK